MLCNFELVNFSVGEVLGRDLHFVASVKALITLKTKPQSQIRGGLSLVKHSDSLEFAKLQKRLKFLF